MPRTVNLYLWADLFDVKKFETNVCLDKYQTVYFPRITCDFSTTRSIFDYGVSTNLFLDSELRKKCVSTKMEFVLLIIFSQIFDCHKSKNLFDYSFYLIRTKNFKLLHVVNVSSIQLLKEGVI